MKKTGSCWRLQKLPENWYNKNQAAFENPCFLQNCEQFFPGLYSAGDFAIMKNQEIKNIRRFCDSLSAIQQQKDFLERNRCFHGRYSTAEKAV